MARESRKNRCANPTSEASRGSAGVKASDPDRLEGRPLGRGSVRRMARRQLLSAVQAERAVDPRGGRPERYHRGDREDSPTPTTTVDHFRRPRTTAPDAAPRFPPPRCRSPAASPLAAHHRRFAPQPQPIPAQAPTPPRPVAADQGPPNGDSSRPLKAHGRNRSPPTMDAGLTGPRDEPCAHIPGKAARSPHFCHQQPTSSAPAAQGFLTHAHRLGVVRLSRTSPSQNVFLRRGGG